MTVRNGATKTETVEASLSLRTNVTLGIGSVSIVSRIIILRKDLFFSQRLSERFRTENDQIQISKSKLMLVLVCYYTGFFYFLYIIKMLEDEKV